MRALKNSGSSRTSKSGKKAASEEGRPARSRSSSGKPRVKGGGKSGGLKQILSVAIVLAALSFFAARYCYQHGYTLYDGDAEAHLNIARRVVDSRTPNVEQFGTVWLPLPHLLLIPFVKDDAWWKSGLAGVFPSAGCFVLTGLFLFAAARRAFGSGAAGLAAALLVALNPNILYLQSTPMTELVMLAGLSGLLWATLWFRDTQSLWAILAAGVASNAASLTRYEGWFLIPFVFAYLLFTAKDKWHALLFGVLASMGPIAWLVHNQIYFSDPLAFYRGPWSAMAIYQRQLAQGVAPYPGDHDWAKALQYYSAAARGVTGIWLLCAGAVGVVFALWKRAFFALGLLLLPPAFYILSMHNSGTPIYVPSLWPYSWYNTRYAVAVIPLAAFAASAVVSILPGRIQTVVAVLVAVGVSLGLYVASPLPSLCWKEAENNSEERRDWTAETAAYLKANYRSGQGILLSFGDLTGALREAGIPLKEALYDGNHPAWDRAMEQPITSLHEQWALAVAGDPVATAVQHAPKYQLVKQIVRKGKVVEIYHREP